MTRELANSLALELKGLIPSMTNQQVVRAAEMVEAYTELIARAGMEHFLETRDAFSVDGFAASLRLAMIRHYDPRAAARADAERNLAAVRAEEALFATLGPEQVAEHVQAIIEVNEPLNPVLATRLRQKPDPANNALLRGLIVARINDMTDCHDLHGAPPAPAPRRGWPRT